MKSLLIIDTPKNCGDCPCAGEEFGNCQADEKNRDCDWYKIPSWCPLKPLPSKEELISKILFEVDGGTDDRYISYYDICQRVEQSVNDWFEVKC